MSGFPRAVYPANVPLRQLSTPEMFVVATLRLWVARQQGAGPTCPPWQDGFARVGLQDNGAPAFDSLLRIVAVAAHRPVDVRCLQCDRLGEDEAWLLQLISLLQRHRCDEAGMIVADWLPAAAARIALVHAAVFAAAMAAHGLQVPWRPADPGPASLAGGSASREASLSLVH